MHSRASHGAGTRPGSGFDARVGPQACSARPAAVRSRPPTEPFAVPGPWGTGASVPKSRINASRAAPGVSVPRARCERDARRASETRDARATGRAGGCLAPAGRFCQAPTRRSFVELFLSRVPQAVTWPDSRRRRGHVGRIRAWPDHGSRRASRDPMTNARLACICAGTTGGRTWAIAGLSGNRLRQQRARRMSEADGRARRMDRLRGIRACPGRCRTGCRDERAALRFATRAIDRNDNAGRSRQRGVQAPAARPATTVRGSSNR